MFLKSFPYIKSFLLFRFNFFLLQRMILIKYEAICGLGTFRRANRLIYNFVKPEYSSLKILISTWPNEVIVFVIMPSFQTVSIREEENFSQPKATCQKIL